MKNILIPTRPDDIHAALTCLALKEKGHHGMIWFTGDFSSQQHHAFELSNSEIHWDAIGKNFKIEHDAFDVVWYRRPQKPTLSDEVHPEDQENIQREANFFYQTFWEVIAPHALWINSPAKARSANSKLLQLKIANEAGLNTPPFIISNYPKKIRDFFKVHQKEGVVYKPLTPLSWDEKDGMRTCYTTEIQIEDLQSDFTLGFAPGIFQQKIQKAYELRVTCFGNHIITAQIKSQDHPKGKTDWRRIPGKELMIEPYELPETIKHQCICFMKKLGLLSGCLDFIVTPDHSYYFLEVNESGQFLWIEDINPSIKMLDAFSDFLISQSPNFQYHSTQSHSISVSNFLESAQAMVKKNVAIHANSAL